MMSIKSSLTCCASPAKAYNLQRPCLPRVNCSSRCRLSHNTSPDGLKVISLSSMQQALRQSRSSARHTGTRALSPSAVSGNLSPAFNSFTAADFAKTLLEPTSAQGLAAAKTDAQPTTTTTGKHSLSMRPITTHVNVLLAGSSHYLGKAQLNTAPIASLLKKPDTNLQSSKPAAEAPPVETTKQPDQVQSMRSTSVTTVKSRTVAADEGKQKPLESDESAGDLHAFFLQDPASWATKLKPILVPQACREMVYTFQESPGQSSTLDSHGHVETLITYLLTQQQKDYMQLCGSRGMHKSLACGCLEHSTTACIYFLPPQGPSKLDLVAMSALCKHVALLPVITMQAGATDEEADVSKAYVKGMLADAGAYVDGLEPIQMFKFSSSSEPDGTPLPLTLHKPASGTATGLSALSELVQLLRSDEVYGLLDSAWEGYNSFCNSYEAAGKDLTALITQQSEQVAKHFAGHKQVEDLNSRCTELEAKVKEDFTLLCDMFKIVTRYGRQRDLYFRSNDYPWMAEYLKSNKYTQNEVLLELIRSGKLSKQ